MNFQGMQSSSYAQAGKAGADSTIAAHAAARRNSPKYDKIMMSADNFRAGKEQAGIKLQSQVTKAGIQAAASVHTDKTLIDAKEGLRNAKRKAGVLAAGGQLLAKGADAFKEAPKYETDSIDYSEQISKLRDKAKGYYDSVGEGGGTTTTKPDSPASPTTSSGGSLTSSAQAVNAGKGTAGKGGKYSTQQMTQFAIDAGFSPEKAKIMGAIGMGESGGAAGIDTVQSGLDPGKSNEYSIGLFQINAQAHGDKLSKLGYTADDLRDPVKNAKVAKLVHDEVGGFTPWSVYTKGIYKNHL